MASGIEYHSGSPGAPEACTTSHVPVRLTSKFVKVLRSRHSAQVVLTAVDEGSTFTQTITVGIF